MKRAGVSRLEKKLGLSKLEKGNNSLYKLMDHYERLLRDASGSESIGRKLKEEQMQRPEWYKAFKLATLRVCRREYTIHAVKQGKMKDYKTYI